MPIYFFTETAQLANQQAGDAFGPSDSNKFRITSRFQMTLPAKAFAVARGQLVVQNVDSDPDTVNVILKPSEPFDVNFTPVKYYVYRGLQKNSFLSGGAITPSASGNSELIATIWQNHENWKTKTGNSGAPDPTPKIFGYDEAIPASTRIDEIFANLQEAKPIKVDAGMWIGNFPFSGGEVGFEIILEEGVYEYEGGNAYGSPKFSYLRSAAYEIDVSGISDPFDKKVEREKILNFVDPAAFYGLFFEKGVFEREVFGSGFVETLRVGPELASQILSKFATKDTVYIDIRNDYGYSYDFYGEYGGLFMFGIKNTYPLTPETYEAFEWPFFRVGLTAYEDQIHLAFSQDNNPRPLLYCKNKESFFGENVLVVPPPEAFTNSVSFQIPNYDGICATYLKLHYFKLPDPAQEGPEDYLTQIMGPIDMARLGDPAIKAFDFIFNTDARFISGKYSSYSSEFGYVAECGVSFDDELGGPNDEKVVFYGRNVLSYKTSGWNLGVSGLTEGLSLNNNFYEQSFLKNIRVGFQMIADGGSDVGVMVMADNNTSGRMVENLLVLGITKAELDALKAVSGLKSNHHRFLKLANGISVAGTDCYRYELHVWGLGNTTEDFQEITPSASALIYVYTKDGAVFCSKNYTAAIPLPPPESRNYEEQIGARIKSGTQTLEDYFIELDDLGPLPDAPDKMKNLVNSFILELDAIPNAPGAKSAIEAKVIEYGEKIWKRAVAFVQYDDFSNPDDRPLYWARLKMEVALKGHPFLLQSTVDRKELIELFEEKSRNYTEVDFSYAEANNLKKILVTGFDPFFLNQTAFPKSHNILQSNPSGCAALAMQNKKTSSNIGYVQAMVVPVRYTDFDGSTDLAYGQGENKIEKYIQPWINLVDMIITISQSLPGDYKIDKYATATRGGTIDNMGCRRNIPSYGRSINIIGKPELEWLKTALLSEFLVNPIVLDTKYRNKNNILYDDNILLPNENPKEQMKEGSGGNYLSNEIFYRVAKLRTTLKPSLPTGHFHISKLQNEFKGEDFSASKTKQLINIVITAIDNGSTGL